VNVPALEVRNARLAVFCVFAACGFSFASWASRIPDATLSLGLSPAGIGQLLLFVSAGSVISLPLTGRIVGRIGTSRTVALGAQLNSVGLVVAGVGVSVFPQFWLTALGLFAFGLGMGSWDAAMNTEGALVEIRLGRAIMPWLHAMFSGGTVVAALIGAAMTGLAVPVWLHLALAILPAVTVSIWAVRKFLDDPVSELDAEPGAGAPAGTDAGVPASADLPAAIGVPTGMDAPLEAGAPTGAGVPAKADVSARASVPAGSGVPTELRVPARQRSAWLEPRTLLIGLVALAASFAEGTATDWIALGVTKGHGEPAWAGVLGFAAFLTAMTLGRIIGVYALDRWGRLPVLLTLFVLAGVGSCIFIFGPAWLAFVGAALWGFGASLGFPVGMSAASDDPARAAARISVVATIGYLAFLGGPPLIGILGEQFGVLNSLTAVSVLVLPAMVAAYLANRLPAK
jgi:MFS family permease